MDLVLRSHQGSQFRLLFGVDEYLDVFPDAVLFVDDAEPESGVRGVQSGQNLIERSSPGIDARSAAGVSAQGARDQDGHLN